MGGCHRYEDSGSLNEARAVLDLAVEEPFARVEDLVATWVGYAEMEIRGKNYKRALRLIQQATTMPHGVGSTTGYQDGKLAVQMRVHKSLKLWLLYTDLEESLGTFDTCKAVYDQIIELRIANPQVTAATAPDSHSPSHFSDGDFWFLESSAGDSQLWQVPRREPLL